ncbi:MAG TPA: glycosyltransferase family 4 protein [Solirubrobacteraceae bacterium]|jgi:glycosyltransferase involved in cell wall biosynthesis
MRVDIVDPSAYTLPYDHALCAALADLGAQIELVTSSFAYGAAPSPDGYTVREAFYRHAFGAPGSRLRTATKLLEHVPDMLRYGRGPARAADVVHFQWLTVQSLDRFLLPRTPTVLTAHDLLPREPRPTQFGAQRRLYDTVDAIVVHSGYGRAQLVERLGVDPTKVTVVHHGAFDHLTDVADPQLPPELRDSRRPAVLFFGLLRPYKGVDVLLEAWRSVSDADLWIVGRPRMDVSALVASAPPGVGWVTRYVSDAELAACFRAAEVIVLPYRATERLDFSGVLASALAFGKPSVISDIGSFPEVAATGASLLVRPGDPEALASALSSLLTDSSARARLSVAARAAAAGPYSWSEAAGRTLALYRGLTGAR